MWRNWGSPVGAELIYVGIASLIVSPVLIGVLALALALPVMIVGMAFREAFDQARMPRPTNARRIVFDFATRSAALIGAVWLMVKLFKWDVQSDILYLVLLSLSGGFAGELAAMVVYLFRGIAITNRTAV